MNTELINYPDRAGLAEGIKNLHEDETVLDITVVYPGTTLRVTRVEGYGEGENDEPTETPADDSEAASGHAEDSEEDESDEDAEEIDLDTASRDDLRAVVADYALDVEIPDHGPLAPLREKVANALNASNNE